jgi:protease-4
MTLYEFLKSILLLFIFASAAPFLVKNITYHYHCFLEPYTYIGVLSINESLFDSSWHVKSLHSFFNDPGIKGIILKINCYKCAAGTSQIIFNEIQQFKKEYPKPVITLIENICISGGYLIASASDYIIAPESALIGGIGTYSPPSQIKDLFTFFALDNPKKEYFNEQTNQSELYNETYQQFTKYVATTRKLSLATVSNWAQEKIFTGKQAYNLGLVNAIGSMHTVITLLKEKALIDGKIELIEKDIKPYHFQCPLLQLICNSVMNENLS